MLAKSILVAYSSLMQSQVQLAFREHCNFFFFLYTDENKYVSAFFASELPALDC